MVRILISLILFLSQIYFVSQGYVWPGVAISPFLLFFLSISLFLLYFSAIKKSNTDTIVFKKINAILGGLVGLGTMLLCVNPIRTMFHELSNPAQFSDVMPQLETLYSRFVKGEFPYHELMQIPWMPFPVYMPLHWMPLAIPHLLGVDSRWIGILAVTIVIIIWSSYIWQSKISYLLKLIAIFLPSLILWGYIILERIDISDSLETLIGAYYMLLAVGLAKRNLFLITIGIICCLLSRYTVIFWLPLFFILSWQNISLKKNIAILAAMVLSVLFFYVLPFYIKEPSILIDGLQYHNHCAILEWTGSGQEKYSFTFELGIYFAPYLRDLFTGSMEHRVLMARILQAILMIALVIIGSLTYKKLKERINFYDMALGMLYLCMLFFYMFGPLAYKYYYIPFLMIAAVMVGKIFMIEAGTKK